MCVFLHPQTIFDCPQNVQNQETTKFSLCVCHSTQTSDYNYICCETNFDYESIYSLPFRVTTTTKGSGKDKEEEEEESEDDDERGVLQLELPGRALLLHNHTDILVEGGQCHLDHPHLNHPT